MSRLSPRPVFWPALALLTACSVIGIKRPPSELEPGEGPECTSSWTLPLLDFAGSVTSGSAAVVFHGQASAEDDGDRKTFRNVAWAATGLAVLFIASGAYGSRQVQRCRGMELNLGIVPPEGPNPNWQEESKPGKGMPGASCKVDTDCGEEYVCDEPMRTCIEPPAPPESPPAPPEPTAPTPEPTLDAGPSPTP